MKVLMRIISKLLILAAVIAAAGGGACVWHAWQQSNPDYMIDRYLSCLIENDVAEAYTLLDQSESTVMNTEEYKGALETQKYILYSGYRTQNGEIRRDDNGSEYVDYHVEFLNAADEVGLEDDFTVKKQAAPVFGVFDRWKVLAEHCMIKDYPITVPAGAELYLDNVPADTAWIVEKETAPSYDCYVIPTIVPGNISVTIRHPALTSVNATLDVTDADSDYSGTMDIKESAQNECKELGVKALKALYSASVSDDLADSGALFADCMETAEQFTAAQAAKFSTEESVFLQTAFSDFAAQFGGPVFTENENGAITTEMTFSYHYVVREDVTYETGEYLEDGSLEYVTETVNHSGDATALMTMAFYDEAWHIAAMELPVIPE